MLHSLNEKGVCHRSGLCFFFFIFSLFFIQAPFAQEDSISIMAYNVENLFDAVDDGENQEDVTFLPLAIKRKWKKNLCLDKAGFYRKMCEKLDWTQEKYEDKLKKIAQVLLDYNGGMGADIILLEELENKHVIYELWEKYLQKKGYDYPIHFESKSHRGIDVGIISRFPLKEPAVLHPIDLSDTKDHPTREILEARFKTTVGEIRIAVNHWPSQRNTLEARLKAAAVLKRIANNAYQDGVSFIAAGDFNTLPREVPNPIENNIADKELENQRRPLVDITSRGSYFYHRRWIPLDRFLISKNLFKRDFVFQIDLESFEVFSPSYLLSEEYMVDPETGKLNPFFIPKRYNFFTGEGYSDHLPIAVKVNVFR